GLNRELASTLARSATLGPILSAAFPIVAAIGFYEVLKQGAEQLSTWISDTFIFTKAMKDAYAAIQAGNKEIQKSVEHTKTLKDEFELIGVTGIAKDTILLRRLSDELDKAKEKRNSAEAVLSLSRDPILGAGVSAAEVQKAQGDLLEAKAKIDEILQEQYNREKEIRVEQQKDRDAAALKAAAADVKEQERKNQSLSKQAGSMRAAMQQELELYKASEKEIEETEKNSFDRGFLSLQQYFAQRRAGLDTERKQELALIAKQIEDAQKEADRAGAEGRANQLKSRKASGAGTDIGGTYDAAAQKDFQTQEANLAKIGELKTKQQVIETEFRTKARELDAEEFRMRQENQQKIDEFERKQAASQGKKLEAVKAQLDAETQQYRLELEKKGADSPAQIDAKVAAFRQQIEAQATFEAAAEKTREDVRAFELEKQAIEIKTRAGLMSHAEAEKEINDLIRQRLPLLNADAAAEVGAAQKTGSQQNIGTAQNAAQGVQNLTVATDSLQKQVRGSLTTDFDNFFMGLGRNAGSVADQFKQFAASIVQSLEQIIVKKMVLQMMGGLFGDAGGTGTGGAGGGGGEGIGGIIGRIASFASMFLAEGGLIQGPGGPKSDSIPARVSPGEYIVKADAVSAFGVANLEAINRGLRIPSIERLALPRYSEGGLVGSAGGAGDSNINLGISLDEGLILKHLSSKAARNIILNHIASNPKAAGKALSRSQ
ncbi:MAG: hypothetical protein WCD68_11415, partial [Candidatus Acidiferrum sp.]